MPSFPFIPFLSLLVFVGSCASAAPSTVQPTSSGSTEPKPNVSAPQAALAAPTPDTNTSDGRSMGNESRKPEEATADEEDDPPGCPRGMVLIDGDYCTNLEMKCLRSTYAKQNDKTICHEFEYPTHCAGERVHKKFCIDKYEYPNKKGERPLVMKNFPEAQHICASQGKRICNETEWTTACEGPEFKPYPYGYKRDPSVCRGDRTYRFPNLKLTHGHDKKKAAEELERLWDAVVSGSQPKCVSDYGVYDMPGNADELAASETEKSPYDNVTTGGPWLEGVRNQCRPKIYTHNEGFSYYYLSFRCCAEADDKPTDPRSPKQIKRGEKWKP